MKINYTEILNNNELLNAIVYKLRGNGVDFYNIYGTIYIVINNKVVDKVTYADIQIIKGGLKWIN